MNDSRETSTSTGGQQFEVVTLGETMLRLTPPGKLRLSQSPAVEMHVGGSESNTAVGLTRLGHTVSWISRLTDNPIGRLIAQSLASQNVDLSQLVWTDEDRVGTFYMEQGAGARPAEIFYDRKQSALSRMTTNDLNADLFQRDSGRLFHTTGITAGVSESARETAYDAMQLAKSAGWTVSFDLNYRARLWSPEDASQHCAKFLDHANLLISPRRDLEALYAIRGNAAEIAKQLNNRWPDATWVVTDGARGAFAVDPDGNFQEHAAFPTETIERLGSGDAFLAGLLSAWLRGCELNKMLRWGCAAAAMKHTIVGDLPLFDRSAIERLVEGDDQIGVLR